MKNKLLLCALLVSAVLFTSACQSTSALAGKAAAFEALGITEATITGKFSHTEYHVERATDGSRRAVFEHSNAWLPKVRLIRERPEAAR